MNSRREGEYAMKSLIKKSVFSALLIGLCTIGISTTVKATDVAPTTETTPEIVSNDNNIIVVKEEPVATPIPVATPVPVVAPVVNNVGAASPDNGLTGAYTDPSVVFTSGRGMFGWEIKNGDPNKFGPIEVYLDGVSFDYKISESKKGNISESDILDLVDLEDPESDVDCEIVVNYEYDGASETSSSSLPTIYYYDGITYDTSEVNVEYLTSSYGFAGNTFSVKFNDADYYLDYWIGSDGTKVAKNELSIKFSDDMETFSPVYQAKVLGINFDVPEFLHNKENYTDLIEAEVISANGSRSELEVIWSVTMTNGTAVINTDSDNAIERLSGILKSGQTSGIITLTAKIPDKSCQGGFFVESKTIPVLSGITSITINGESTISQGAERKYTAAVKPATSYTHIKWSVDDEDLATIDEDTGMLYALVTGDLTEQYVTITATAFYGDKELTPVGTKRVKIAKYIPAKSIKVNNLYITAGTATGGYKVLPPAYVVTPSNATAGIVCWAATGDAKVVYDEKGKTLIQDDSGLDGTLTGELIGTVIAEIQDDLGGVEATGEANVYVVSMPKATYNSSSKNISVAMPAYVNVGRATDDMAVKGYYLEMIYNGQVVASTKDKFYSAGVGNFTIDTATLYNLAAAVTSDIGDSADVSFRVYPANGAGHTKDVYAVTATEKIYKVTASKDTGVNSVKSPIGTEFAYGFAGQEITFTTELASGYSTPFTWKGSSSTTESSSTHTVKVNSSTSYNKYKVSASSSSSSSSSTSKTSGTGGTGGSGGGDGSGGAGGASGKDKVPKTGQSNFFMIIMMIMLASGAGVVLYMTKTMRLATPNGDIIDVIAGEATDSMEEEVVCETVDVVQETVEEVVETKEEIAEEDYFDTEDEDTEERNIFGDKIVDLHEDDYYFD